MDQLEEQEQQEILVPKDCQVVLEHLVLMDQLVLQDLLASQDHREQMVPKVNEVRPATRGHPAAPELLDSREPLETRELPARLATLEQLASRVRPGQQAVPGSPVRREQLVLPVRPAQLGRLVLQAVSVLRARPGPLDHRASVETLDCRVSRAREELLVLLVKQDSLEVPDNPDSEVRLDSLDHAESQELPAPLE